MIKKLWKFIKQAKNHKLALLNLALTAWCLIEIFDVQYKLFVNIIVMLQIAAKLFGGEPA